MMEKRRNLLTSRKLSTILLNEIMEKREGKLGRKLTSNFKVRREIKRRNTGETS
jgi:hypothetical protein